MKLPIEKSAIAALAVLCSASPLSAALDGTALSSTFGAQYDGNQIWDGTTFQNQWAQNGGHTTGALSLDGASLVTAADANNGWVEHDNDTTPWELASGKWTIEVSMRLIDSSPAENDGFVLWGERDSNRAVLWIQSGSLTDINGTAIVSGIDNTDAFHTIRVAFDPTDTTAAAGGTHHVWRDDVLVSGAGVDLNLAGGTNSRLIVGDCCTGIGNPVDDYSIGYIRYQADQALAPIPEPSSLLLGGFGVAVLALRRRR